MSSSAARYFPAGFGKKRRVDPVTVKLPEKPTLDSSLDPVPDSGLISDTAEATASLASSDESLMSRICDNDKEALALLFRRYARIVRGVAYRVLRDTSEADDLLQDIFLLVHRLCRTFDSSKSPVRFWILQMTYRRAVSRRRYLTSRHFYNHIDLTDTEDEMPSPAIEDRSFSNTIEHGLDNRDLMQTGLAELSPNQRETLLLFFFEGYTLEEISAKLGQSYGNVRNHYYRGLDKLRKWIFSCRPEAAKEV